MPQEWNRAASRLLGPTRALTLLEVSSPGFYQAPSQGLSQAPNTPTALPQRQKRAPMPRPLDMIWKSRPTQMTTTSHQSTLRHTRPQRPPNPEAVSEGKRHPSEQTMRRQIQLHTALKKANIVHNQVEIRTNPQNTRTYPATFNLKSHTLLYKKWIVCISRKTLLRAETS